MSADARQVASEPRRITVDNLKSLLDRGMPVQIIDARSDASYQNSDVKIPNAIRISPQDLSPLARLPHDILSVTYCT